MSAERPKRILCGRCGVSVKLVWDEFHPGDWVGHNVCRCGSDCFSFVGSSPFIWMMLDILDVQERMMEALMGDSADRSRSAGFEMCGISDTAHLCQFGSPEGFSTLAH